MKKSVFRYIEAELYDYPATLKEIGQLREEIIESGAKEEGVRVQVSSISDPTATRATMLLTNRRLKRLVEVREAIEAVIYHLEPHHRRLVELKYWDRMLTNTGIAQQLNISEMTFYRWRRDIVIAIGQQLGLANLKERC